jgi:lysozyme
MSIVNQQDMEQQLIRHEGIRLRPYLDTAKPKRWTLGVGYNGTDRGWDTFEEIIGRKFPRTPSGNVIVSRISITQDEALKVLASDIDRYEGVLRGMFPVYDVLDGVRKRVVLDLAFNMGYGLAAFHNTRDAIERAATTNLPQDWQHAAAVLGSNKKWAGQVKSRAKTLIQMLATGLDIPTIKAATE